MEEKIKKAREHGFTLMEIVIAVFILASSLVVLIGLQSSIIARAAHDKMSLQAMLFARRVLAQYEANIAEYDDQDFNGPATDLLSGQESDRDQAEIYTQLHANLKIEEWNIPQKEKAMKRIALTVSWGEGLDSLSVFYFVPYEEVQDDEISDDTQDE